MRENFGQLFTTPESVQGLRQTILQLAVQGKLVAQDPEDEPAEVLLEKFGVKNRNLPVSQEERYFPLPTSWAWIRLTDVAEHRLGKMLDKAKNKGKLYPYLRNTNVQWFEFDLNDIKAMRFEEEELGEFEVKVGDLLICEGGEPGRAAIWRDELPYIMFQKALHRVRPTPALLNKFLLYKLRTDAQSNHLNQHFTGATIKHFTGRNLASYVIGLPPLNEQKRIVAKVDSLMALCDTLETKVVRKQADAERLAATVVHHLQAA